jgi:hypothetical protein
MSEWGFYCDVETGRLLDNPYIFQNHTKEQTPNIQLIYVPCIIILISFIAFIYN